jgi:hypothetical protein
VNLRSMRVFSSRRERTEGGEYRLDTTIGQRGITRKRESCRLQAGLGGKRKRVRKREREERGERGDREGGRGREGRESREK